MNYRYEAEKGTIITTNLSPKVLKDSLGDRIFNRVQERTAIVRISDVESYRKTRRKEYVEWIEQKAPLSFWFCLPRRSKAMMLFRGATF